MTPIMPEEIEQFSYQLGRLAEAIENQEGRLSTFMIDAKQDRDIAAAERAAAATERQEAQLQRGEQRRDIRAIKERLDKIEPSVKDFVRWREKIGVGIVIIGGILWGAGYLIYIGFQAASPIISDWLRSLIKG